MTASLDELLARAKEKLASMSDAEIAAMRRAQRDGYVRAEMSWPKPKFTYVDGVKVYASYADYLCA